MIQCTNEHEYSQRLLFVIRKDGKLRFPRALNSWIDIQDDTNYYLVMEFCPGGTLAKFVGTKTMQKETGPQVFPRKSQG